MMLRVLSRRGVRTLSTSRHVVMSQESISIDGNAHELDNGFVASADGSLKVVAPDAMMDAFFDPAIPIQAVEPEEAGAVPAEDDILGALDISSGWRQAELAALFGIAALSKEWYVVNAETQVAACLIGGFFTMYLVGREPVMEWYADAAKTMLAEQNKSEKLAILGNERIVEFARNTKSLPSDIEAAAEEKLALIDLEHEASALLEKHSIRNEFQRKLEALVVAAQDAERQEYKTMVTKANAAVTAAASKAAFKKEALAYAIDALADPTKAGDNPVISLYRKELASLK